ncbi:hypothetical protein BLA29_015059 [Euroglyphus maynei]|uniref:Uncharacterized protein n=1 Tax=Euroglyphus maynei TaxID=6958 RepID=A0A1Y3AWM9_EURMA|nr:hypothetical protein BLA29_015059 [Euroglyphus maynei]
MAETRLLNLRDSSITCVDDGLGGDCCSINRTRLADKNGDDFIAANIEKPTIPPPLMTIS